VSGEGPAPLSRLVAELSRLPGIGQRTAQRLAFHILRAPDEESAALATAIREVKEKVGLCERCFNLSEGPLCRICQDSGRDQATICVVEEPADVIPIERTHEYRGLYHVLGGALSPIDGVDAGDLKTVAITTPLTDSGDSVRTKYFRYWEDSYNASTNPGHVHALKFVVDAEGVRRYGAGYASASNAALEPYASAYFEQDANHRIRESWADGACGCGGGATGTHEYEYETNPGYSDGSGYDTAWARRTVVHQPDGSYLTQYFDEVGQGLHRVLTDDDPDNTGPQPNKWITKVTRDSSGLVTMRTVLVTTFA